MRTARGKGRLWVFGISLPASSEAWAYQGIPRSVGEDVGADHPEDALIRSCLCGCLTDGIFDEGPQALQCARGERERVAGRRAALLAQDTPVVGGEVQRLRRSRVEVRSTGQADVELRRVAGEDGELYTEGRLDVLETRIACFQRVQGVVEQVEDPAVRLVASREGAHAPDHARCGLETGELLPYTVETAQRLRLGHGVERPAVVGDEVDAGERFEAGSETGLRTPDALRDCRDQPSLSGVEIQDPVRLRVADRTQHDSLTPVDRHPRPPPSRPRSRSCRAAKPLR